eukprot:jgi/Psemu1/3315/gm1.3315_g
MSIQEGTEQFIEQKGFQALLMPAGLNQDTIKEIGTHGINTVQAVSGYKTDESFDSFFKNLLKAAFKKLIKQWVHNQNRCAGLKILAALLSTQEINCTKQYQQQLNAVKEAEIYSHQ